MNTIEAYDIPLLEFFSFDKHDNLMGLKRWPIYCMHTLHSAASTGAPGLIIK